MDRRNFIVRGVVSSIGVATNESVGAAWTDLRQSASPAQHLGIHGSVWAALVDRSVSVLPDIAAALCGEKFGAGNYRCQVQEDDSQPRDRWWRLYAESPSILSDANERSVLVCSSSLAARSCEFAVLRLKGVASAGGVALYYCGGNAGSAVLLVPTPAAPARLLGLVLNEQ